MSLGKAVIIKFDGQVHRKQGMTSAEKHAVYMKELR